jgi:hypothetical protein
MRESVDNASFRSALAIAWWYRSDNARTLLLSSRHPTRTFRLALTADF